VIQVWLLRQAPYLILSVGVILFGYWIGSSLIERGRNEIRPQLEKAQQELASERATRVRNEEAIDGYLAELETIRKRPRSSNPVRLCVTPASQAYQPSSTVDGSATPAGSSAGEVGEDLEAGPDIGPELRELAFQCDMENAKLRALQGWVTEWTK
jgi:hypothetical protein